MRTTMLRIVYTLLASTVAATVVVGVADAKSKRHMKPRDAHERVAEDGEAGPGKAKSCYLVARVEFVKDPVTGEERIVTLPSPCFGQEGD